MTVKEIKEVTIKGIRKAMRELNKDGGTLSDIILIPGWGQIRKIGNSYAVGPVPEKDDSDPMSDYSACVYGLKESWVLGYIKADLKIS